MRGKWVNTLGTPDQLIFLCRMRIFEDRSAETCGWRGGEVVYFFENKVKGMGIFPSKTSPVLLPTNGGISPTVASVSRRWPCTGKEERWCW